MININGVEYATKEEAIEAIEAIDGQFKPKRGEVYCSYNADGYIFAVRWSNHSVDRVRRRINATAEVPR